MTKALVLLSGGFDSSALLVYAQKKLGFEVSGLFIDHSQRAEIMERRSAEIVCSHYGAPFYVERGPTMLSGHDGYVPARNLVLGAIGASVCEALGLDTLLFGFVIARGMTPEHSFPDTSEAFVAKLQRVVDLSTRSPIHVSAPLLSQTKGQVRAWLERVSQLKFISRNTWTCWEPKLVRGSYVPCSECDACKQRRDACIDGATC